MSATDVAILQNMLTKLAGQQVSDLHLKAGALPVVRRDGTLETVADERLVTPEFLDSALGFFLTEPQRATLEHERQLTIGYSYGNRLRLRVSAFYQQGLPELTLRFIPSVVRTPTELGLPQAFEQLVTGTQHGLVLLGGPFGSGRSSTMAGFIQVINHTSPKHIVTIEEPIEYVFLGEQAIIDQREVGTDVVSWEEAVASLPAEDVDVVALAKLPSAVVVESAVELALGGKLVLVGVEAESTVKAVEQLVTAAQPGVQEGLRARLSDALVAASIQQLVPRIGGGRVLVSEVLVTTPVVRTVIREGKFAQLANLLLTSRAEGMVSFDHALAELVKTGEVMREVAEQYARDKEALRGLIRRSA